MNTLISSQPKLVDNNVKYFLSNALQQSYEYKNKWTAFCINLLVFISIVSIFTIFFSYKYKNRLPLYEIENRNRMKIHKTIETINKIKQSMEFNSCMFANATTTAPLQKIQDEQSSLITPYAKNLQEIIL